MNTDLIVDLVYLIIMAVCIIIGNNVIESWWSFLFGAITALAARNVGSELMRRFGRQQRRRVR